MTRWQIMASLEHAFIIEMAHFLKFNKKHHPHSDCTAVPQKALDFYSDKLPTALLEEWKEYGWCAYGNGFLWTINPADYVDVLADWIEITDGTYAFLRSAFGGIFYWNGTDAHYLDVLQGDVSPVPRRMEILFDGVLCDNRYLKDVLRQDLFCQSLPRIGQLTKNECYGFLPPLVMGGAGTLSSLNRVNLSTHLALLAQVRS